MRCLVMYKYGHNSVSLERQSYNHEDFLEVIDCFQYPLWTAFFALAIQYIYIYKKPIRLPLHISFPS